jgi:hypothetical protein
MHMHFTAYKRHLVASAACMMLGLLSVASRAESPHLAWKEPLPGTPAVLGDDGGGADTVTVCDTGAKFTQWLGDTGDVAGCHSLPAGLPIVLGPMSDDPEPTSTLSRPLVKIVIPSRHNYSGYVELFGQIHPNIPKGTVIRYKREGNETLRLAPSRDSDLNAGPNLGEAVTATILRYDPASDGMNLYVEIRDGKFAGQKGWMLTLGATSADGEPVDIFYESLNKFPANKER